MKARVYSWKSWDSYSDDKMIEICVDKEILKTIIGMYEEKIDECVYNSKYEEAKELIEARKELFDKLVEFDTESGVSENESNTSD